MRFTSGIVVVGLLCLAACGGQYEQAPDDLEVVTEVSWQSVAPHAMTEAQKTQHEIGLAATNVLASELMGELTAAMDAGGPAEAIVVCGSKAPAIAAQVSEDYGLRIGRTSHRLRNPDNSAPDWAQAVIAEQVGEPTYLAGPGGEFGALLPIRLKAECQMCHGPQDQIDGDLLATIVEIYPEDQAVGFEEGDLRGWFWIEVPAPDDAASL
jgi:hypothetical protein